MTSSQPRRPKGVQGGVSPSTEATQGGRPIGLIAGYGRFPLLYAQNLKAQGYRIFCAAIREESDPAIEDLVDECVWLRLGQLGKLIDAFRKAGVAEAVMAGKVHKTRIYQLRPDIYPPEERRPFGAGGSDSQDADSTAAPELASASG